eukprot:3370123-Pyramimonas_sp.AAC.1
MSVEESVRSSSLSRIEAGVKTAVHNSSFSTAASRAKDKRRLPDYARNLKMKLSFLDGEERKD